MAFPLPCPLRGRVPTIAQALPHFGAHGRPSPIPSSACIGHRWEAFSGCFLCLCKKNPHGLWHDTCRSLWGFLLTCLGKHRFQSQSPRSLTLYFTDFPARKNGQQSFYPLLPVHEPTKTCAFRLVDLTGSLGGCHAWLICSFGF